mmetsp:Transcript_38216/g.63389  ORF Transcript_38216/g.63389 Transcript_38216/m.63389 type:complete len:166 (+) Transcript_38216:77-574(+)
MHSAFAVCAPTVRSESRSFFGSRIQNSARTCDSSPRGLFTVQAAAGATFTTADGRKFTPYRDWVVIRKEEAEKKSIGGILLPDTARGPSSYSIGEVVAAGPGDLEKIYESGRRVEGDSVERKFIPTSVKPGDRVMFMGLSYQETEVIGEKLYFIKEEEILALVPK